MFFTCTIACIVEQYSKSFWKLTSKRFSTKQCQRSHCGSYFYYQPDFCNSNVALLCVDFQARKEVLCHLPLPTRDLPSYVDAEGKRKYTKDCYIVLHETPEVSCYDAYKSRAYLALKRREYMTRVSPSVTEIMSRSATRLSSRTAQSGKFYSLCRLLMILLQVYCTPALKSHSHPLLM